MKNINKKQYENLYDYFWNRADVLECSILKNLYYEKIKFKNRKEIFQKIKDLKNRLIYK